MKRPIYAPTLFIFSILAATFCGPVRAASNIPDTLNLGFYAEHSAEIPAAVKNQKKFIYRFNIQYFTEVKAAHYSELIQNPRFSSQAKADLVECTSALLPSCVIPLGEIRGSAFLDESGKSIWTNCHLVNSWIEYKKQKLLLQGTERSDLLKNLLSSSIPFTLLNADGSIALTSSDTAPAVLEALAVVGRSNPELLSCSIQDDAVKIRLPVALAEKGIQRSKKYPLFQTNQKVYIGGNPRATNSRAAIGKLDSDGNHFYWTTGSILLRGPEFKRYFDFHGRGTIGFDMNGPNAQAVLSDSIEGMSGGPALNESGELVGIYKGFLPLTEAQRDIPFLSLILDNSELRFIEILSEHL